MFLFFDVQLYHIASVSFLEFPGSEIIIVLTVLFDLPSNIVNSIE